ncbi:molecular chaperone [Candidatus Sodalis pierantonius]|uniref:fimbrial biogenesis chaperone n=1 Tax=Candidatus Sodalis pierantonii TaxID=1486991 RepID=UPI00046CB340|nr:molecular chaperone [Candidatus Sodalis pierantonius]
MQTRIKPFFRPQGVAADRGDAWKKLEWFYQSGKLTVKNPTPYFITVNKALADGQQALTIDMVAPFTSEALPRKNQNVTRAAKSFMTPWQILAISVRRFHRQCGEIIKIKVCEDEKINCFDRGDDDGRRYFFRNSGYLLVPVTSDH